MGSAVPSYSAMAGVRQFKGSSSAMTVSVKGTPCRSSSGAPSIWYFTSCKPFCRYSAMAGVRQFKGSSSAMTVSVKGTPCRSSSGAPSIWYFTSCKPFCRCSRRASHCGGTSLSSGKGTLRLLPTGGTWTGISPSSSSSGTSASGGGANRGGAAMGTCSRMAAATMCWIAFNKAGDSSSVEVSEDVLRRGGSATRSVTLGGRDAGGMATGADPVTPGSGGAPAITCKAWVPTGGVAPFVYLLPG
ncbi:UNVERIFIED_CONTAM: hypothetical protein Sradi_0224500 [Sesamum radiatum]|uniref:Uncharacterized protein n=1 Tax=Sesamum radiatum TaxID=300843 RepID=A0AAW2W2Y5_SESRA